MGRSPWALVLARERAWRRWERDAMLREHVVALAAEGFSRAAMARAMGVSPRRVDRLLHAALFAEPPIRPGADELRRALTEFGRAGAVAVRRKHPAAARAQARRASLARWYGPGGWYDRHPELRPGANCRCAARGGCEGVPVSGGLCRRHYRAKRRRAAAKRRRLAAGGAVTPPRSERPETSPA